MTDPTVDPAVAGVDAPPDAGMVRAWLQLPASSVDDDQLELLLQAELTAQAQACRVDPWAADLTFAIYRRVGRAAAATGAPLGVVVGNDFGSATLPRWDAEIERYERPYRIMVLG
jgi:hypothetical protein